MNTSSESDKNEPDALKKAHNALHKLNSIRGLLEPI